MKSWTKKSRTKTPSVLSDTSFNPIIIKIYQIKYNKPAVCLRFNRYFGLTDIGLTRVHCLFFYIKSNLIAWSTEFWTAVWSLRIRLNYALSPGSYLSTFYTQQWNWAVHLATAMSRRFVTTLQNRSAKIGFHFHVMKLKFIFVNIANKFTNSFFNTTLWGKKKHSIINVVM